MTFVSNMIIYIYSLPLFFKYDKLYIQYDICFKYDKLYIQNKYDKDLLQSSFNKIYYFVYHSNKSDMSEVCLVLFAQMQR